MSSVKVFLDEEYGYRSWVWDTGMDEHSLVKWFEEKLFEGESFPSPENLCGSVVEVDIVEKGSYTWLAHLHMKDDTWLQKPTGEIIRPNGWDEEEYYF